MKGNQIFPHGWLQRGRKGRNKKPSFSTEIPSLPKHVSPSQETLVGRERRASFTQHLSWVCWLSWGPVLVPSVVHWLLTTVDYWENAGCPWMNSTRNFKVTSTMCFGWEWGFTVHLSKVLFPDLIHINLKATSSERASWSWCMSSTVYEQRGLACFSCGCTALSTAHMSHVCVTALSSGFLEQQ